MKKYYFAFISFCFLSIANGQIINFPDANFKAKLLTASPTLCIAKNALNQCVSIDTNNDGNIQVTEALAIDYLQISSTNVTSLVGIQSFANLTKLDCTGNYQLTSIDLSNMVSLTQLYAFNCTILSSANLIGLSNLTELSLSNCNFTSLNISGLTSLTSLGLSSNNFSSINVSTLVNLIEFAIDSNLLTSLNVNGLNQLTNLDCSSNNITALILGSLPLLTNLACNGNQLVTIDISGLNSLQRFNCGYNRLTQLNFTNNPNVERIFCDFNQLTTLDVTNLIKLIWFFCSNNLLVSIFIKNGKQIGNLGFQNNTTLRYLCTDENKITQFQNLVNQYGNTNCQVNSYCSFVPGGNYNIILGTIRYDLYNNGCDASDLYVANAKMKVVSSSTSQSTISNVFGNYFQPVLNGIHVVTPILENPTYFNVSPTSATITFPATTSPAIQDFCVTVNGVHKDLEVNLLPVSVARPGFDASYKLVYKNKGNQTQSGAINFTFNDAVLDFITANPATSTQVSNNLSWNFIDLKPFESREIAVTLNANSPMEIPALNGNDILPFTANVTSTNDETPNDNIAILNQTVVNSFDPNDKTCLEGYNIVPAKVGEYVHYMIRFENTGTFAAQNIVVKDMIDLAKFDVASLIPVKGSHDFYTRINGNKVEFIFENINLPFADASNDGYVSFKIKTKSTLVLGNTFSNSANIYFDYNFPIVTNTATTTISNSLATNDFEFASNFSIYPNPANNNLTITNKNDLTISSHSIYNTLGQLVQVITSPNKTIDVSELKSGNYFIKIISDKGISSSKFTKL